MISYIFDIMYIAENGLNGNLVIGLGTVGAHLGHKIVFPGAHLGHSWGTVGAQLGQKVTWGTLEAHLGQKQLGHSWGTLGAQLGQIQPFV